MTFRKLTLKKLALLSTLTPHKNSRKLAGNLTELVKKELGDPNLSFRQAYMKMKPGPEREEFIFNEITKRNIKPDTAPVTVKLPNGTELTYFTTKDYVKIDGIRVPMSGKTAQRVAKHFNMVLPTKKQVDQIWENAQTKVDARPLSAGGKIGDRYYTGEEVVRSKIGDPDTAEAYSKLVDQMIQEKGGPQGIIAGPFKNILQPKRKGKLNLYGGRFGNQTIQPEGTSHDTTVHSEYMTPLRLVDNKVNIKLPNGKIINTSMQDVLNHPDLYKAVSDSKGYSEY